LSGKAIFKEKLTGAEGRPLSERVLGRIAAFVRAQEACCEGGLIAEEDLRRVAAQVAQSPKGGRTYAQGRRPYAREEGLGLLICAWDKAGEELHLIASYYRLEEPLGKVDLWWEIATASETLFLHLLESGLEPELEERRVGNLAFIGYLSAIGPSWVAPAERSEARIELVAAVPWNTMLDPWKEMLMWEHLGLKPRSLARRVAREAEGLGGKERLIEKALEGKIPGLSAPGPGILASL